MKKLLTVFIAAVLSVSMLCGWATENKYIELSSKYKSNKCSNNYAVYAGEYLEYFSNNLHKRTTPVQKKKARDYIISELKKAGYGNSQIEIQNIGIGKNIVLTVKGKNAKKQIVAGAHYDGNGDGDNGSGVALLLAEAVGLANQRMPVTIKYIFFDLEEIGMIGSACFVGRMSSAEKRSTLFAVNIDSVAFGDYCCIYGGVQNNDKKTVVATEGYDYAMRTARKLGFNTYDTTYLDGYYKKHGKGPGLDSNGVFTNPWTYSNPAPENSGTYSPSIGAVSDHEWFAQNGIPYIYFEATNWFATGGNINGNSFSGYYETTDTTIGKNGMFMNTSYDTIENLEKYFPGRAMQHFNLFSPILSYLILHPEGI